MFRKLLAVVLCAALCVSILPVLSISSSADNSGFIQIRVFYKIRLYNGNYGEELSALVTDNGYLQIPLQSPYFRMQITRIQIRNDSNTLGYYQFDLNAGGQVPYSGTLPTVICSGWDFSNSSTITAFTLPTTNKQDFTIIHGIDSSGDPISTSFNSSFNRTFFGKTTRSGYINFNTNQMIFDFVANNSPTPDYIYLFFRNVITGIDSSGYLANMEQYLSNIDSNVDSIAGWMEEEHDMYQQSWDNGAGAAYNDAFGGAGGFFGSLFGFSQFSFFSSYFNFNTVFSSTSDLISRWFSQSNYNNINGSSSKSPPNFVDYFSANLNGELNIWGGDEEND